MEKKGGRLPHILIDERRDFLDVMSSFICTELFLREFTLFYMFTSAEFRLKDIYLFRVDLYEVQ